MQLDHRFCNGKAQPHAAVAARQVRFHLVEALEDARELTRGNANAIIRDSGLDIACILLADFGWFPEGLGSRHGEICCTVDMIEIAIQLGRYVDPGYYSEAERYGRNHLLESQFLSLTNLSKPVEQLPEDKNNFTEQLSFSTIQDVMESQVGGFVAINTQ